MAIYMQAYLDLLQALTDRCIYLGTFRQYGEYENENPDLTLHRRSAYYINKLIKRCKAAEENRDYFEELAIKSRRRATGKWEEVEVRYNEEGEDEPLAVYAVASMHCPICNRYHNEVYQYGNPTEHINFCPHCGAEMQKGGDGE